MDVFVGDGVKVACVGVMVGVRVGGEVMGAGVFVWVAVAVFVGVPVAVGVGSVAVVVTIGWLPNSNAPAARTIRAFP